MTEQPCSICGEPVDPNPRYPRYACPACASRAVTKDGRKLEFGNVSLSGGFEARYADTGEVYDSHTCFIDGIECHADEARFGGIVIQRVG